MPDTPDDQSTHTTMRYLEPTQASGRSLLERTGDRERWDLAMLVRERSVEGFVAFASHAGYLAGLGHRTAALEDSRLLPLTPVLAA